MIDDRLKAAAHQLRSDLSGPIPEPPRPKPLGSSLAIGGVIVLVVAGGLWAIADRQPTSRSDLTEPTITATIVADHPDTTVASPSTTVSASTTVSTSPAAVPTTSQPVVAPPERLHEFDFVEWVGHYTIDYQPATIELGSTGTVTYTLDMNETMFCIRRDGGGSGCSYTGDGSTLPETPQALGSGGGTGDGRWHRYLVVPADVDIQLLVDGEPACTMHRFSLEQFGNATIWACENTEPEPVDVDIVATRGDQSVITNQFAHLRDIRPANPPTADPVTSTGIRIGDPPPSAPATTNPDGPAPWALVISREAGPQSPGTVVGYAKTFEVNQAESSTEIPVYDELGNQTGFLQHNWVLVGPTVG